MAVLRRSVLDLQHPLGDCVVFKHLGAVHIALRGENEIVKLSNNADSNEVQSNVQRVVRGQNNNQIADLHQCGYTELHINCNECGVRVFEHVRVVNRILCQNQSATDLRKQRKMQNSSANPTSESNASVHVVLGNSLSVFWKAIHLSQNFDD